MKIYSSIENNVLRGGDARQGVLPNTRWDVSFMDLWSVRKSHVF